MGKTVVWENGIPVPVYNPPSSKDTLINYITEAENDIYEGEIDPETGERMGADLQYVGKTKGQVIAMRVVDMAAAGSLSAAREIWDRKHGKPKQSVESVSMNFKYTDYLNQLADQDDAEDQTRTLEVSATISMQDAEEQSRAEFYDILADEDEEEDRYACLEDL